MSDSNIILNNQVSSSQRVKLVLFFLFTLCLLAVSITFFSLSVNRPYMGIRLSMQEQDWVVEVVDPNASASKAGIIEGEIPVIINGQPAQAFLQKYEKSGLVFGMLIKELTVIDSSGHEKSASLKNASFSRKSLVAQIMWIIVCVIYYIIGYLVFFKRPGNHSARLFCITGLLLGLTLSANMAAEIAVTAALQVEIIATTIGPWLILHFFLTLPEENNRLRTSPYLYLIYIPPVITLTLFPLLGYENGQSLPWFRSLRIIEYAVGFLAVVGVAIFNYFHATSLKTQQQMKIILISCLLALVPFLILFILPEVISGAPILPLEFMFLFLGFIPLGIGYAVIAQKLMDIDIVIRRGVIYGLISIIMSALLSTIVFSAVLFHDSIGLIGEILIILTLGVIATFLFGPLKKWIETLVDKLFYKDRYDYNQVIKIFTTSLSLVKDSTDVSRLIVGTLVDALNLLGCCLLIKTQPDSLEVSAAQGVFTDREQQQKLVSLLTRRNHEIEFPLSASKTDPSLAYIIPLMASEKEVGILCISPKISRQGFSSDDMYLLQGIASTAAIALRSATLIHEVDIRNNFISIASHELRTPMTAIMGYADLLLKRDPPADIRKQWLTNILDSSKNVAGMVDDLLNVARIQSGRVDMKLERVKLSDVLAEVTMIRQNTGNHKITLEIEPVLPDMLADRDKLSHVIGNLLDNAIKYSPKGGHIILSAKNDNQGDRILISVADQGIGISPEDQASLFTTFHRIHRDETHGIQGSGLGLYIVKEWVEAMGGEVWLESKLDKGSTFFISIPTQDSRDNKVDVLSGRSGEEHDQKVVDSGRRRKNS